jgi:hypothetical protein
MQSSYSSRLRRATWLAFVIPLIGAVGASVVLRSIAPGDYFWPVLAMLWAVCALALWACVPWWKHLDDMQKHGHMVSWYWGGLGGGILALMWLVAAVGVRGELAVGGLIVLLGQLIGFLLFWVGWARGRRGPSA